MNHSFYDLERYVDIAIERIADDRTACDTIAPSAPFAGFGHLRPRIGALLIKLGERIGGPAVYAPQAPTPWPSDMPRLGF